jgi:guanosine-3',5'-bis(diphosphate) 3'-pyrophosphohydrolase
MSAMISKAIKFATEKHEGQTRKVSGDPYITHPIMVSYILAQYKQSAKIEELICASLLHDTLEDTNTTFSEIVIEFSPMVASLVLELTNDDEMIKQLGKKEYSKIKWVAMTSYALTIKLADRFANIQDKPSNQMVEDTIEIVYHVLKNKKPLTGPQIRLCDDIITLCKTLWEEL